MNSPVDKTYISPHYPFVKISSETDGMQNSPGRPRKPIRYERELRAYVTEEQHAKVEAEAEKDHRDKSAMVRILLDEALAARGAAQ